MIIRFTLENWLSFRDETIFTMIASKERQHGERVPRVKNYLPRILPASVIIGGNASGKSNFFKALEFVRDFVVGAPKRNKGMTVSPFMPGGVAEKPTRFCLEMLIEEKTYEYSFSMQGNTVLEEKLVLISSVSESVLFRRSGRERVLAKEFTKQPELQRAFDATSATRLFLTDSVSQGFTEFAAVYNWFRDSLVLVSANDQYAAFGQYLSGRKELDDAVNDLLEHLDTGIHRLEVVPVKIESLGLPKERIECLMSQLKEGESARYEDCLFTLRNGELTAGRLVAHHVTGDGEAVFDMRSESDGTRRIIDLVPTLSECFDGGAAKVLVFDDIDRSLHTLLVQKILEKYFTGCSRDSRSQLVITAHDALLLDQRLFRRDEMWLMKRNPAGVSRLKSIGDFRNVREDKDLCRSYLTGRYGGIPEFLLSRQMLGPSEPAEEAGSK